MTRVARAMAIGMATIVLACAACRARRDSEAPQAVVGDDARKQFEAGVTAMDAGADRYDAAIEAFRAALRMSPDLWEAQLDIGIIELRRSKLSAAAEALEHSVEIHPSAEGLEALGEVYMRQGKSDKAIRLYEQALTSDPDDLHLRNRLCAALRSAGRADQAEAELRAILSRDTDNLDAYNQLAAMELERDDLDMAELILHKGLSRHPEDPSLLTNMGLVELRRGSDQTAFGYFDRASKTDPQFLTGRINKAAVFLGAGDHTSARTEFEFVLGIEPANTRALMGLGVAKRLGGDFKGARQSWEALLEHDPENADAHFNLALLALEFEDDPAGAREQLLRFKELAGENHPRHKDADDRLELIKALMESK